MKAIALYRISTNENNQVYGIGVQRHEINAFASSNGIEVIEEVVEACSGRKPERPSLEKALALCRKHKAILLVTKPCRLTRSVEMLQRLIKQDVDIVIAQFGMGAQNKMLLNMMTMIYEFEAETIASRTKAALAELKRRNVDNSEFRLGPPLAALHKAQQLAHAARRRQGDTTHARYFALIDTYRSQGWGYKRIASQLTLMGIPTPSKRSAKWNAPSVRNIWLR